MVSLGFFAISMAMFGLTVGAVWVYVRYDRFSEKTLSYDQSYFSTGFALSTLLGLVVQMTVAVTSSISFGIGTTLTIGATCYILLIPTAFLFISPGKT